MDVSTKTDTNNLTDEQKKRLKGKAHALKPVVLIGQHGMKETTMEEIHKALSFHQLLKIKISAGDKPFRQALTATILEATQAALIQQIGSVIVIYKRNNKKPSLFEG